MQIVHNQKSTLTLLPIRGGKQLSDSLQDNEKELLNQMADAFSIVYGGQFKRRRQSA